MDSSHASDKRMSEKQRLKLEKFAQKKEKQAHQVPKQQQGGDIIVTSKSKKIKKPDAAVGESRDWVEETPIGQKKILKPLDDDFQKAYVPKVVESAWYNFWEEQGLFEPQLESNFSLKPKGKYVIAIPPPNVTGKLHIGHALALSLEDTLIRWHRMQQFSTLFIPGCDHAGIATQAVIEKQLARNPKNGKMNNAAKQINQAIEEREFSKSTQFIYQYMYDELFDIYIDNSKMVLTAGTPTEIRSATDTHYTALESGLRLLSPFMPFLTEELWQRLPSKPEDNTSSITIAEYPEYESSFDDKKSEIAYELVLGCSKGIRSLIAEYAVKDRAVAYIAPLNQTSYDTASSQLSAIESLCGKIPVHPSIPEPGSMSAAGCAVFPVSADANVYLEVKDRIQDLGKQIEKIEAKVAAAKKDQDDAQSSLTELSKVQDKDATEAMQLADSRKQDVDTKLKAWEEMIEMLKRMSI